MNKRRAWLTHILPKLLLLVLLTGMEECGGCDDIGILHLLNADPQCLTDVIVGSPDTQRAFIFPGESVSFLLQRGPAELILTAFDFAIIPEDPTQPVTPASGCRCLAPDVSGRSLNAITNPGIIEATGFTHALIAIFRESVTVSDETRIIVACNDATPPALQIAPDLVQTGE